MKPPMLESPRPRTLAHGVLTLLYRTGGCRCKVIYRCFPSIKFSSLLTYMRRGGLIEHEDVHKTTSNFVLTMKGMDTLDRLGDYSADLYWDQLIKWVLANNFHIPIVPSQPPTRPKNPSGYLWDYKEENLDTISLLRWVCDVIARAHDGQYNPSPQQLVARMSC